MEDYLRVQQSLPFSTVWGIVKRQLGEVGTERDRLERSGGGRRDLHQFRVAVRRLDASIGLGHWALWPTEYALASAAVSPVTRGLGRYRDADVLAGRLSELRERADAHLRDGIDSVIDLVDDRRKKGRAAAVARAVARSSSSSLGKPIRRAFARADGETRDDPLAYMCSKVWLRSKRLTGARPSHRDLHAFRLEMKGFRYALEALAEPSPPSPGAPVAAEAGEAREVTQLLGRYGDAFALTRIVSRYDGVRPRLAPGLEFVARVASSEVEATQKEFMAGWQGRRWPALKRLVREHSGTAWAVHDEGPITLNQSGPTVPE